MHVLVGLNRICRIGIWRYRYHYISNFSVSTASWLKSVNNKLEYTQLQRLSVDESLTPKQNQKPRLVKDALFSKVDPTPLQSPKLLSTSSALTDCIDLDVDITEIPKDKESTDSLIEILAGNMEIINKLIPNCTPYSHCYAGHQFGNFAGQLGDGRAICLGEYINNKEERWEMQLKGAGLTPYSRFADGRAVLRSSIREYLISEAMHYLGIPTTRAGILITSDIDKVIRDEFYNGNARYEPTAIVLRLSPSFIRFGSFEICSKKGGPSYDKDDKQKSKDLLQALLNYIIEYHFTEIWQQYQDNRVNEEEMYKLWWIEVIDRTIKLAVKWQTFGFVHGVLNTDNMSILGLTIDYGPFGFMEYFNDEFVPNYSDHHGRYSYKEQIKICQWNLDQLAIALDEVNILSYNITKSYITNTVYDGLYDKYYKETMISKFGLFSDDSDIDDMIELFFDTLQLTACDFTNAFRALNMLSINGIDNNGDVEMENNKLIQYLVNQCSTPLQYGILKNNHKSTQIISLQRSLPNLRRMALILRNNPNIKNLVGLTLEDIDNVLQYFDNKEVVTENKERTDKVLINDMTIAEKQEHDRNLWRKFVEQYRNSVNKQYIETGNKDKEQLLKVNEERIKRMNEKNAKYILRNYLLQNCINDAENGDMDEIESLLQLIRDPYNQQVIGDKADYDCPAPHWSISDCISCSS